MSHPGKTERSYPGSDLNKTQILVKISTNESYQNDNILERTE